MANKPDMLFWVPDNDALKIQDPGGSKKANGFLYREKPAFQFVNYLFNRIYQWFKGLQGSYCQVVVGSASQIIANTATHTINQLNNTVVAAGSRVLFLEGTHTLTADLALTNINCTFDMENGGAIIDLASTYKLSLTGARTSANLKFTNVTDAVDAVSISGASSNATLLDISPLKVTGSSTSVITCVGSSASVKIGSVIVPPVIGALTDGATIAWNLAVSEIATITLGGDRTLANPTNKRVGRFTVIVTQDGTGGRTLTFGTDYKGQKVYIDPTAGAVTIIELVCDGTSLYFQASEFSTGDGKFTLKTSADPGWVMANDGTLGNVASGATTRNKPDTIDLYTLIWNNVANADAPVQDSAGTPTTRGANAAADFAANKRLSLTKTLGRALASAGAGAGLTSRALGSATGDETIMLDISMIPTHTHGIYSSGTTGNAAGHTDVDRSGSIEAVQSGPAGGNFPHPNMQPSTFWNVLVKL